MRRLDKGAKKTLLIASFSRAFFLLGTYLLITISASPPSHVSFFNFLETFANYWDGSHYLFIAQNGYVNFGVERYFIVFPPLYPLLIRIFGVFAQNPALTGIVISNLLFVLGCLLFYKLLRLDYTESFSLLVIVLIALFPTSYFFSTAYAESLFLFLFSASFLLARQGRFFASSFLTGLAALTKPFGIIIWPALFVEWFNGKKRSLRNALIILLMMILSSGFYLLLNYAVYNDFFAFQKYLTGNWHKSFSLPWKGIMASWEKGVFAPAWTEDKILVGLAEALTATIGWFLIPIAFRKLRTSYFLYYLFAIVFFTSTGFILSGPRYLLSIPPFFVILASLLRSKPLQVVWVVFSTISLFFLAYLFAIGRWAF